MKSKPYLSAHKIKPRPDLLKPLQQARPSLGFDEVARRLASVSQSAHVGLWIRLRRGMDNHRALFSRPAVAAYTVAVLLVGACNLPTEYSKTVGHTLRVLTEGDRKVLVEKVESLAGDALTDVREELHQLGDGLETSALEFTFLDNSVDIQDLAYQIESLPGVQFVSIDPIDHEFQGTLLTSLLHRSFDLEINITDLTAAQVEQAILKELEDRGIWEPKVSFSRENADGMERVQLRIEAQISDSAAQGEFPLIRLQDENRPAGTYDEKVIIRKKLEH